MDRILVTGMTLRGRAKCWFSQEVEHPRHIICDWTFESVVITLYHTFITTVTSRKAMQHYMNIKYTQEVSQAVLAPPSLSYKPVTSAPHDHGNISHDPTRDSSCDPFATCISRDLSAHDPGNLRPRDPGKITHDLSRNWSSTCHLTRCALDARLTC